MAKADLMNGDAVGASGHGGLLHQPPAVWAITFACVVSYMGIGLVDPILPTIAEGLDATAGQTELLFTSYLFVTAIVMFFSAWVSSRFGVKRTLIAGLVLIILFAAGCSVATGVDQIIGFRAGWGLGNALFVSTALAAIVASTAKSAMAIVLYEAAIGLGFAIGPMVGGLLGEVSWRGPFAGTAVLMALGLVAVIVFFRGDAVAPATGVRFFDGVRGAADRRMAPLAGGALFYNFGFFMMLAYAPFPLAEAAHASGRPFTPMDLGLVFFGWGLALAVSSVFAAPRIEQAFGVARVIPVVLVLLTLDMAGLALFVDNLTALIVLVIAGGLLLGVMNTLLTTASMSSTTLPRPVASSAYSGVRFIGSAMAPTLVGPLEKLGIAAPFTAGTVACAIALVVLGLWARAHARRSRVVLA
ncbi:MFS transporter [Corynebacterium sp.]|uniref:MFS transporter n=1 Tax=Corynebacterium sp. TaxID=1720 RepID=UPI0026DC3705|nr:MFS transporter [Corynebacterium sp.]MDO4610336.1 MFS transporter [Corynebacterium sp.]